MQWSQVCTDLSLFNVIASKRGRRNSHFSVDYLDLYYLLCRRGWLLMPRQSRAVSSLRTGTKVLYFAEVCQYRASGTIHTVKGITGV